MCVYGERRGQEQHRNSSSSTSTSDKMESVATSGISWLACLPTFLCMYVYATNVSPFTHVHHICFVAIGTGKEGRKVAVRCVAGNAVVSLGRVHDSRGDRLLRILADNKPGRCGESLGGFQRIYYSIIHMRIVCMRHGCRVVSS